MPLVSIGIPVYNEARYIESVLRSVLTQDYPNLEIVISENWSTDGTADVIRKFAAHDKRIHISQPDQHLKSGENFIRALQIASGEFFVWVSGHDLLDPAYIRRCTEVLMNEPKVVLTYARANFIDLDGTTVGVCPGNIDTRGSDAPARFFQTLWGLEYGYLTYGVMRRAIAADVFVKPIDLPAPDYLWVCELACRGEFAQIDEFLMHFRIMPDYGSWEAYVNKLVNFSDKVTVVSSFQEMVKAFLSIIERHFPENFCNNLTNAAMITCLYTKHLGILQGMLTTSHATPHDVQQTRKIIAQLENASQKILNASSVKQQENWIVRLLTGALSRFFPR